MTESKISLNTQNSFFFFPSSLCFLSPEGKLEASCDNLQHTSVPLIQPTVYIEDRDPIPEEQVKKSRIIQIKNWALFLFQLLVQ